MEDGDLLDLVLASVGIVNSKVGEVEVRGRAQGVGAGNARRAGGTPPPGGGCKAVRLGQEVRKRRAPCGGLREERGLWVWW